MSRRLFNLLVWVLVMGLLSGCWDRREIEQRSSVFAMAIDNHPEGVEVSVQIPIPIMIVGSGGGGGGQGGQGAVHNFSAVGETVSEALENLQNQTNQDLFLGHTRLLLLSEDLVREKGLKILDALRRQPEIRRQIWPLVVDGPAKEALAVNLRLAEIPTEYILDFVENGASHGRMADTTLGQWFINQSDPTRSAYINYLHVEPGMGGGQGDSVGQGNSDGQGGNADGKVFWKGLAVMKGDHMVGSLSREESNPILELVEEKAGYHARLKCSDGKGMITFEPKVVDPSVSVSHQGKKVKIRVKVEVWGGIVENTCYKLDLSQEQVLNRVEEWLEQAYEKQFRKTLHLAQKKFRTDVFQFGSYMHAYHPHLWNRIDWEKEFPKADIKVDYQVTIKTLSLEAH
ncbi:Ger(x)C family spore germination protein [Planifilum fimeticola]